MDAERVIPEHGSGNTPAYVVEYEWPTYPYVARLNYFDGQGFFRLQVDPETGKVLSVAIVKSTTYKNTRRLCDKCVTEIAIPAAHCQ